MARSLCSGVIFLVTHLLLLRLSSSHPAGAVSLLLLFALQWTFDPPGEQREVGHSCHRRAQSNANCAGNHPQVVRQQVPQAALRANHRTRAGRHHAHFGRQPQACLHTPGDLSSCRPPKKADPARVTPKGLGGAVRQARTNLGW